MTITERIQTEITNDSYNYYPNDGQKFVAWYLRNIYNLDPSEAKSCITDGAGDKQIDAVYIDNQDSIIYIIQGKFYCDKSVDSEPLREVLSSWEYIKDLAALQDAANDKLKQKIKDISDALEDDYQISFELITTGTLTESAQDDLSFFRKQIADYENLTASLNLIDVESLSHRYDDAQNKNRPYINHTFHIPIDKYMQVEIDGAKALVAAVPLSECVKIPGINDGSLFRKNVRQYLQTSNKVNKGIAETLKGHPQQFFFLHNGITAICSNLAINGTSVTVRDMNVVNGCQSLSTIYHNSEYAKKSTGSFILFRIYEINSQETADKISTCTNSQSAVKARDLRSNDKAVLSMRKTFMQKYTDGYFITKRGEFVDPAKYNTAHVVNLTDLGKQLIAWQSQRPTISYSETKIFDKYFSQLFHSDYAPDKILALSQMQKAILPNWEEDNPLSMNEALLAMKSYAIYHHLYAISVVVCLVNNMPPESVPNPAMVYSLMSKASLTESVIRIAGQGLSMAFDNAVSDSQEAGKVFSPQNWTKNKNSLRYIREAIKAQVNALKVFPDGKKLIDSLNNGLKMNNDDFESRWTAD